MSTKKVPVQQPKRWDAPMDPQMTDENVEQLLQIAPFCKMERDAFSGNVPLPGILKNDCRLSIYREGDVVIRKGDYGNSAYLILDGSLLVTLAELPPELQGRPPTDRPSWWRTVSQAWTNSRIAESRDQAGPAQSQLKTRTEGDETRVFVQDIPGTIQLNQARVLKQGELFGELAALNRSPRSATVIASGRAIVLEMRWQGFRDLMKYDPALRDHVEQLYREHSLNGHLRLTPELSGLSKSVLQELAENTSFESLGQFDWHHQFRKQSRQDIARRIEQEPVIAEEKQPANDFFMIRNGFARLSRRHGDGHRTIAYLGKGQTFGWREIAHNWRSSQSVGYSMSLRAVGYVELLRIPAAAIQNLALPNISQQDLPALLDGELTDEPATLPERRRSDRQQEVEAGMLEFMVENRFINGTQAMMIDLDRCTRCDDCVRACAATHDNNPRFLRQGPRHDNWMIASACMHCADPVCMIGCPTGAIGRDETSGSVAINDVTCIGCGVCANSCPYENIQMVEIRDRTGTPMVDQQTQKPLQKATKCDFCVDQAGGPACQRACPHDALYRVDLTTPSELYHLTQP